MYVASGFPLTYAESLVYGMDYAEIGARLLRTWGVPYWNGFRI
jgi:hypothetical protein